MVVASQLTAKVGTEGVDTSKQQLQSMGQAVSETSSGFKSMLGNALSFAAGQAVFNMVGSAVGFLKNQVADSIGLAIQHQDILEQTAKVLKSTGGAAGMTQQSLEALASSLEKTTYFSKDATEQGENLLLTFTGIGKDVFPLATKTMLDMSKSMGQDVKSTAIMMGKALNDPAQGLTALTRVGVTFTDQQKQMIQQMVAAGDTAGAQKIMLQELQREFGGSADATTTLGGKFTILKDRLNDFKERIGSDVLPMLSGLLDHLVSPALDTAEGLFHKVGDAVGYVGNVLGKIDISGLKDAWGVFSKEISDLGNSFDNAAKKVNPLKDGLGPLDQIIKGMAEGGLKTLTGLLMDASRWIGEMSKSLQSGKGPLDEFVGPVEQIASLLGGQFTDGFKFAGGQAKQISTWFAGSGIIKDVGQEFKNLLSVTLNLAEIFTRARGVILDVSEHAFAKFAPYIEKILPPLIKFQTAIDTGISKALQYVKPYIDQALQAFEKFADGVIDRVTPIIDKFIPYIILGTEDVEKAWNTIWPSLAIVLKGAFDMMAGFVQIAWSLISGIINIGLDLMSGNWKGAWKDMQDMLGGVWDGIKNVVSGGIETAKGVLKGMQSVVDTYLIAPFHGALASIGGVFGNIGKLISDATSANWGAIPGDLHALSIPGFAGGTDYAPGGLAMVGERGPEAMYIPRGARIVPNNQLSQMSASTASGGSPGQPIYLQVDGQTFARLFLPHMVSQIRNQVGIWGM